MKSTAARALIASLWILLLSSCSTSGPLSVSGPTVTVRPAPPPPSLLQPMPPLPLLVIDLPAGEHPSDR